MATLGIIGLIAKIPGAVRTNHHAFHSICRRNGSIEKHQLHPAFIPDLVIQILVSLATEFADIVARMQAIFSNQATSDAREHSLRSSPPQSLPRAY